MPYILGGIKRGKIKTKTIKMCHIATYASGKSKQNGTAFYALELGSRLMHAWSWSLKAFETDFDDISTCALFVKDMHFSNVYMYEMSK